MPPDRSYQGSKKVILGAPLRVINQALHKAKANRYYIDPAIERPFLEARVRVQSANIR